MATYAVPSGTFSYSNTLTANTADSISFADRAGYLTVTNTGSTVMYARADGQAATIAGEGCLAVLPGQSQILANGEPLWYQSSKVIPKGQPVNAQGTGTTSPFNPAIEQPYMSSGAGQMANPGTSVSVISAAADTYTLSLAG